MRRRILLLALVLLAIPLAGGLGDNFEQSGFVNSNNLEISSSSQTSVDGFGIDLDNETDEGETVVVTIDGSQFRFNPSTITITEGDTVNFLWSGELLPHNAVERNGLFDSGDPARNVDYSYTFNVGENGSYEYVCEPHEDMGMIGTIIVEPLPVDEEPEPEPEPQEDEDTTGMAVGDGTISAILFSPWFLGIIVFVGFISINRDRFQLGTVFDEDTDVVEEGDSSSDGETLVDSYRARVLTLCALYVAQGIPWGFMTIAFLTFLADKGVGAGELALMLTLGTLPWSFKFFWGPIIDLFQYPEMGRRRPWILLAQSGMVISLAAMMLVPSPEENITVIAWMFFVYNVFTSLQDVSTDALAIDILKPHEIEKVNSYMFTSKTIGGIIGGAGLGIVIGTLGIKGTILLQIPILIGIMLVPLFMTERPGEKRYPWSKDQTITVEEWGDEEIILATESRDFMEILSKVKTAFTLRSARLGILLSLTISLYAFIVPVLPLLFIQELDWTIEKFNATKGGLIMVFVVLSYLVGGQLGKRFGGKSVIIYSALFTSLTTALWGLSEPLWGNTIFMILMWSVTTFTWGVATINIYALVMQVTWSEVGGTQFTAYMAMMNLSAIIGYQLTGPITSRFDYPTIFLLAAVFQTLVIFGALFIDPTETRNKLGTGQDLA